MFVPTTIATNVLDVNGKPSISAVTTSLAQPVILRDASSSGMPYSELVLICVGLGVGIPTIAGIIVGLCWVSVSSLLSIS